MRDENALNELMSVCNFDVKVESIINVNVIGKQCNEKRVKLRLIFDDGSERTAEPLLSGLDKVKWDEIDQKCILYSKNTASAVKIANCIHSQLTDDLPHETRYKICKVGLYCLPDTVIYVAGDRVYIRSPANNVNVDVSDEITLRLDIDENLKLDTAFNGLMELISLAPRVGWLLLAYTISGIIRQAFVNAGITPDNVLMIVGKSGMHKSCFVPLITQLYNRGTDIRANTRFNSSDSFIEDTLDEYRHCTCIIDDIHTGSSASIKRKNETTAEEIIRRVSDNTGRGRKDGKKSRQIDFECNVVFIGEYFFGSESTAARMLCAELTHKINGVVMDKYQRSQRLLVSTFYACFIQWYVDNFDDIRDMIDKKLTAFRASGSLSNIHGRLAETLFCLRISLTVLFEFCVESELMTLKQAKVIIYRFECYVRHLIEIQQNRSEPQDDNSEAMDYLSFIKKRYQIGDFNVAENKTKFNDEVHDGVIHYECLCLRGESLKRVVKQKFGLSNLKPLTDYLKSLEALKQDSDGGSTVQINGLKGKRFYAIWLKKLNLR